MIRYSAKAKARQLELQKLGFYHGEIDGLFGVQSKRAERKYLKSIGQLAQSQKRYSLRKHRVTFSADVAKLIQFYINLGFEVAIDDVKAVRQCGVHMKGSQHEKGLAVDLLLYTNGKYLTRSSDHQQGGEFWQSLSSHNRWGGNYNDGNHYERLEYNWS